ncbi:MAG: Loki-CTERM sorting domain-containing protein [Promethearchaeota archaeon]
MPSDALIPGYEIVTILGVSIVTIISIIYIKRKKNM